jgi:hypothetical protein
MKRYPPPSTLHLPAFLSRSADRKTTGAGMPGKRIAAIAAVLAGAALLLCLLQVSQVDTSVSKEDEVYIDRLLADNHIDPGNLEGFDSQLRFITAVQAAVLRLAPEQDGIPSGHPRELKDLFAARRGLCYDRSRAIEKTLGRFGLHVRHIALYSSRDWLPDFLAILNPSAASHALTEVMTDKGWLIVGSNTPWLSLDSDGNPLSMADLSAHLRRIRYSRWEEMEGKLQNPIFRTHFGYYYGVYSRHGKFFPPYNGIPDVHWGQFLQNF